MYNQHYLGGTQNINNYDEISSNYNFANELTRTSRAHHTVASGTGVAVSIADSINYDHVGRVSKSYHQINTGENILIAQIDYNELGGHSGTADQCVPEKSSRSSVTP